VEICIPGPPIVIERGLANGQLASSSVPPSQPESTRFFRHALIIRCVAMGLAAFLQLLVTRVILHQLGNTQLALWTLIYQIVIFLSMLDIGVGQGISRLIAEYEAISHDRLAGFWGTIKSIGWMIGLIYASILVVGALVAPHILTMSQSEALPFTTAMFIFAGWGLFRFRLALPGWGMYATTDLIGAAMFDFSLVVLRPLGIIAICHWFDYGIVGMAISVIATEAIVYALARLRAPRIHFGKAETAIVWRILRYSGSVTVISLAGGSFFYLTGYLIGSIKSLQDVNIYQCSTMLGFLVLRLSNLPLQTVFPILVHFGRGTSLKENLHLNRKPLLYYGAAVLLGAMLLICANHLFVTLWVGEEFYAGDLFTLLFGAYIIINIFQTTMKTALASISDGQWQLAGFVLVEIVLIVVCAPYVLAYGLTFFPGLLMVGNLIPAALCIRQIASRIRRTPHALSMT
jgi:O-antigen/teichoic acid export membrane protein